MSCTVCLEEDVTERKVLSCGHAFHPKCIIKWFTKSDTCPTCRAPQLDDEIIIFKKMMTEPHERHLEVIRQSVIRQMRIHDEALTSRNIRQITLDHSAMGQLTSRIIRQITRDE